MHAASPCATDAPGLLFDSACYAFRNYWVEWGYPVSATVKKAMQSDRPLSFGRGSSLRRVTSYRLSVI